MIHVVEPLSGAHELSDFSCGRRALDNWLIEHALTARGQGVRTYVALDGGAKVIGYFAIAPHLLARSDLPLRLGRGAPRTIPAVLLAKLARHAAHRGKGLGGDLLVEALTVIVQGARAVGGRLVVVDAIDEAAERFYRAHDFEPLPGRSDRLVLKLSTAASALGIEWP